MLRAGRSVHRDSPHHRGVSHGAHQQSHRTRRRSDRRRRHLRHRRGLLPAEGAPGPVVRDPRGARRHGWHVGPVPLPRASGRTRICTPSATSSSRGATRTPSPSAGKILAYLRETVTENGIDANIRFHHKVLGAAWSTAEARWTVDVERADTGELVQFRAELDLLRRRLLPLRRGLHPRVRGPRALPRPDRAPAALAGGPRLHRQEGRHHRQRRDRGDVGARDGRHRRTRHDAAALADLRHAGAVEGHLRQRGPEGARRRSRLRAGPPQEHPQAARRLRVLPAVPAAPPAG